MTYNGSKKRDKDSARTGAARLKCLESREMSSFLHGLRWSRAKTSSGGVCMSAKLSAVRHSFEESNAQ